MYVGTKSIYVIHEAVQKKTLKTEIRVYKESFSQHTRVYIRW